VIEVDGAERIGLGQYVADTVSMSGLHGGQRCRVIRPRAGIARASVALGLQRLKRRLLPFTVRLLCPPPHRPLRPFYQRCQGSRQLCKIALVRYRAAAVAVVSHGTTLLEWSSDGTARTHRSPSLLY
jgi:hypothetical protein